MQEASNFNYTEFIEELVNQVDNVAPEDLNVFQKKYVKNSLKEYATIAAEFVIENENISVNKTAELTQIIAEWTFHKCIDLMRSSIPQNFWDDILQKTNFTAYEIFKDCTNQRMSQIDTLAAIEWGVNNSYNESVTMLREKGFIDSETFQTALKQSNIDTMFNALKIDKDCYTPSLKDKLILFLSKFFAIISTIIIAAIALIPVHMSIWEIYSEISLIAIAAYMLFRNKIVTSPLYLYILFGSLTGIFLNHQFVQQDNISVLINIFILGISLGSIIGYKFGQKKTEL